MTSEHKVLHGIGVCAGTASGPVAFVAEAPGVDEAEPKCTDVDAAVAKLDEARDAVVAQLKARADKATDEKSKGVLGATAQMAADKGLYKNIVKRLKAGDGMTHAVAGAASDYAAKLAKLGGYFAERVTDVNDVRDRLIAQLRGLPAPGVPDITTPVIVVARDLAPAETATLHPGSVLGITVGCVLANLYTGSVLDIVFGSLATFLAGLATARFGKKGNTVKNRVLGCLMPVVFNAVIVGAVLTWGYQIQEFDSPLKSCAFNALTVGVGEAGVLYLIAYPLLSYLPKIKSVREFIARFNGK